MVIVNPTFKQMTESFIKVFREDNTIVVSIHGNEFQAPIEGGVVRKVFLNSELERLPRWVARQLRVILRQNKIQFAKL